MRVKYNKTAATVVELTRQSAMEARDGEMLQLQLLELTRQFVEAVARKWGAKPDTLQVTVEREGGYAMDVTKFHIVIVSSAEEEDLDTTPWNDGPLTYLGLRARMALLGFKL